ncbi:MAG: VWA domain-containing protein, partial [Verrucomicrobiae bacterium]|nr:VWA domain-containing protein [Verrucomicrobiae bacterium]
MTELLLKLLGARVDAAGEIAGVRLAFHGGGLSLWFLLIILALGGVAWWSYFRNPVTLTPRRRWTLFALRCGFLLLLAGLLLRPVLAFTVEGSVRRALLVLIDGSESMGIQDPRTEADDIRRAAIARGNDANPAATNASRIDLTLAALKNPQLNLLPRLDAEFDLVPFQFGRSPVALPRSVSTNEAGTNTFDWLQRLASEQPATAIGEVLRETVNRKRGQSLAGVFLITDGANNLGLAPQEAAEQLKRENVPLYIYGVGITSPRDIIVTNLAAPEVAFLNDEVLVNVHVRAQGLNGEKAKVHLKLGATKVDEKEITFGGPGEQIVA